jgi:hypothetical protein
MPQKQKQIKPKFAKQQNPKNGKLKTTQQHALCSNKNATMRYHNVFGYNYGSFISGHENDAEATCRSHERAMEIF